MAGKRRIPKVTNAADFQALSSAIGDACEFASDHIFFDDLWFFRTKDLDRTVFRACLTQTLLSSNLVVDLVLAWCP
jgi:hypothetical protein